MIHLKTNDARVQLQPNGTWTVIHPASDAVLAACDTKEEASVVREAFNDLARQLRAVGHKVK